AIGERVACLGAVEGDHRDPVAQLEKQLVGAGVDGFRLVVHVASTMREGPHTLTRARQRAGMPISGENREGPRPAAIAPGPIRSCCSPPPRAPPWWPSSSR